MRHFSCRGKVVHTPGDDVNGEQHGEAHSVHLSPCGRGRIASTDAIRVRGYGLSIERNPSSGTDFVRATFSHKWRREGSVARMSYQCFNRTDSTRQIPQRSSQKQEGAVRNVVGI
jgi:hypothetical protein